MENNKNVVVKKNTSEHLAPSGRGWHAVPGEGVLNKEHLIGSPSSPFQGTSKAEKLFDNPPTPLRGTSPTRGADKNALCAKHPAWGEVNGGFTLIELLVVVLIIGILAAVAVPQYQVAVAKSRYATLKQLVSSMVNAQEIYYLANNAYTTKFEDLTIQLPGGGESNEAGNEYTYPWGSCRLSLTDANVRCVNTKVNLAYQAYYQHSKYPYRVNCYVMDNTDTVAHKVCKNETGKNAAAWSSDISSSYHYNAE